VSAAEQFLLRRLLVRAKDAPPALKLAGYSCATVSGCGSADRDAM
jgi:hypothetical protein